MDDAGHLINVKNRSHTITAEVEIPRNGAKGVLLAQAGRFGGWSLYLKDGKPTYSYNWLGLERYTVAAKLALPVRKGEHPLRSYACARMSAARTSTSTGSTRPPRPLARCCSVTSRRSTSCATNPSGTTR